MVTTARAWLVSAWDDLSRLGTATATPGDARAIAAANRFFVLATIASVPWLFVLAIVGGPAPAPVATHAAMMAAWVAGVWLNKLGLPLVASVLALLAPLLEYAYLADLYSRAAAFQLHLLAIPALTFAIIPTRRWAVRLGIGVLAAGTLLLIYVVPNFQTATTGISAVSVRGLAVGNVLSTLALLYTIAAFNSFFFNRERRRNDVLLSEAQSAAQTDSLTDSLNRRGIAPIIASAARKGPYALALVDLDRFKRINDALGHGAGDVVLANVARSITRSIGDEGTVARWGGEEFLVVLPKVSLSGALSILERVRADIEDEYSFDSVATPVTISAGVAHGRQLASKDDLLRLADAKLYEAKASGRNLVLGADLHSLSPE